jgi:3-dehydroquinate synthase
MNESLPPLSIRSGQGDYAVEFPAGLADLVESMAAVPNAIVIADRHLARLYAQPLAPLLAKGPHLLLDATEDVKTPAGVLQAWEFFQAAGATRQTNVLVLGGGIIQDIAQFAAHNYHRGLAWHFAPTTLLSMADSCIGAKCGINLGAYKNQLGVFHSPAKVWICRDFLATLTDTEIRSGYGEILKLHLTRSDAALFRELRETVDREGWRSPRLERFIRQSLEVKKGVIEEDEYERDLRRILNYGHTFGHALEAITHHGIPHGLAVAWGLDLVNFIAWRTGLVSAAHFDEVHGFVRDHFAWKLPAPVSAHDLIDATRRDKKNRGGRLTLIVPERLGTLTIISKAYDDALLALVSEYLADHDVCSHA